MITIQSGKLTIPEEDRFVGFSGDNLSDSKRFVMTGHGTDTAVYSLCLRFDDDSVRVIPLTKSLSGSDLILTWTIQKEHLVKSGIVMAQVKSVAGNNVDHTDCDYFIVSDSAELPDDSDFEPVSRSEVEERVAALYGRIDSHMPYVGSDDYWYLYDPQSDSFVRSRRSIGAITVDSVVTAGSHNPIQNGAIKTYVDNAINGVTNTIGDIGSLLASL